MQLTLLQQAITAEADPTGTDHPNAVWYPAQVTMDNIAKRGSIVWYAYHDATEFGAGKSPVGQHTTQVDTPAFLAGAAKAPTQSTIQGVMVADVAIAYGQSVLDTDSGAKDAQGQPVMVAFFASASPVQVTV